MGPGHAGFFLQDRTTELAECTVAVALVRKLVPTQNWTCPRTGQRAVARMGDKFSQRPERPSPLLRYIFLGPAGDGRLSNQLLASI